MIARSSKSALALWLSFGGWVLVGCGGGPAGYFEKTASPEASIDGVSGGDGYTGAIRQDYTQNFQFAKYDILWVLDNSGSMSEEIQYMKDNAEYFEATMTYRRSIEYRMAVVNTDWRDLAKGHGQLRGSVVVVLTLRVGIYLHTLMTHRDKDAVVLTVGCHRMCGVRERGWRQQNADGERRE